MKHFLLGLVLSGLSALLCAQSTNTGWKAAYQTQKVFIENKGQFNGRNNLPGTDILYGTELPDVQFFFTKSGVTYRLDKKVRSREDEREAREEKAGKIKQSFEEREAGEKRTKVEMKTDFVQVQWLNSNPDVQIEAAKPTDSYFSFSDKGKAIDHLKGYEKITYKNLYPNIDVEYVFHPKTGIEYSFILYPGADASQIKMKYSDVSSVYFDEKHNLILPTRFGKITEHTPVASYLSNSAAKVSCQTVLNGKTVSFAMGAYNKNQTLVIDPWVQTPSFNTQWQCVWECEHDGSGNAYLIGGVMPMQLLKYNSAGTLQWTYTTPYDTSNCWLGTFATDNAGNSYVTAGSIAQIQKVNTSGTLVWNNSSPGGIFSSTEFWNISFNCDQTKLIIGGTGNILPPLPYIYQVDMNSGNVTSSAQITGGALFPTQEVRAITACGNGKYYFLTHDSIGYINQNFGICSNIAQAKFYRDQAYHLSYKCENFRVNNTGICAIRSYGGFVYINRGSVLEKRALGNAAIVGSVAIPSGAFTNTFGSNYVENSGIDIDSCGNIFVGSKNLVVKYDANLNQLGTYTTTFNVYDVAVSTGGNIIVCGSTGNANSGARSGSIQSIAAGACSPMAITCCDASFCAAGPFCTTDAAVTLTPSVAGGTWSGAGITNGSTGTFSPAAAGQGTHYIVHTMACGSDSIPITVNICASLTACLNNDGSITVSGGAGPYTWYKEDTTQNCSACLLGCIIPPGCATTTYSWTQFATGTTATPPKYPSEVVDANSNQLVFTSTSGLSACASCTLGASAASTNTTCGIGNGTATVTPTGGTPTGYSWSNGGSTATISNLSPGTYTVTVTASGCTATATATVASSTALAANATSTSAGCSNTGTATANVTAGSGPFTYLWSSGATTQTASSLAAGTYTVTVTGASNCTASASTTVTSSSGITASASSTNAGCVSDGTATANVTSGSGPFTYLWSSGATTQTASNLAAGTYTVTVTGASNCTASASVTVGSSGGVTLTPSTVTATCGHSNGSASVSASGGAGGYTYLWSTLASTSTISNVPQGTYTVTVTSGNCSATASVNVSSTSSVSLTPSATAASCSGNNGSASVSATGGSGTYTYLWSNGITTSFNNNLAAGTYTVTANDGAGCTATASATVGTTNGLTLTPSSTNTTCGNNNGSASVSSSGGSGSYTYLWSNSATTSSLSNLAAGTYSVTVNDGAGCTATASVTVNPSGNTPVTITSDKTIMCASDSAQICAPAGYVSYLWNTGQTGQCIYTKLAGNYYVTVTDAGSCTATSNHLAINVHPLPPVSISVSGDTLTAYNAVTYQWYFNGTIIQGATSPMIIANQTGYYQVLVSDTNGCTALSNKANITITGIETISAESEFKLYPNPLESGRWHMEVGAAMIGNKYEIYDDNGRLVYKSEIRNVKSEIDFTAAKGIYFLKVYTQPKTLTRKLIKL